MSRFQLLVLLPVIGLLSLSIWAISEHDKANINHRMRGAFYNSEPIQARNPLFESDLGYPGDGEGFLAYCRTDPKPSIFSNGLFQISRAIGAFLVLVDKVDRSSGAVRHTSSFVDGNNEMMCAQDKSTASSLSNIYISKTAIQSFFEEKGASMFDKVDSSRISIDPSALNLSGLEIAALSSNTEYENLKLDDFLILNVMKIDNGIEIQTNNHNLKLTIYEMKTGVEYQIFAHRYDAESRNHLLVTNHHFFPASSSRPLLQTKMRFLSLIRRNPENKKFNLRDQKNELWSNGDSFFDRFGLLPLPFSRDLKTRAFAFPVIPDEDNNDNWMTNKDQTNDYLKRLESSLNGYFYVGRYLQSWIYASIAVVLLCYMVGKVIFPVVNAKFWLNTFFSFLSGAFFFFGTLEVSWMVNCDYLQSDENYEFPYSTGIVFAVLSFVFFIPSTIAALILLPEKKR